MYVTLLNGHVASVLHFNLNIKSFQPITNKLVILGQCVVYDIYNGPSYKTYLVRLVASKGGKTHVFGCDGCYNKDMVGDGLKNGRKEFILNDNNFMENTVVKYL